MAFHGDGRDRSVPNDPGAVLLIPLTIALVALLAVFFVLFQYATVDGPSMRPTLLTQDRLLITRSYDRPRRGDIVVFYMPGDPRNSEVVKRVVGVSGDVVAMHGDVAWVNGVREPLDHDMVVASQDVPYGPKTVPAGTVFVLGDNRPVSLDSRFIGFVPLASMRGRAVAVFSPVTRMRLLTGR